MSTDTERESVAPRGRLKLGLAYVQSFAARRGRAVAAALAVAVLAIIVGVPSIAAFAALLGFVAALALVSREGMLADAGQARSERRRSEVPLRAVADALPDPAIVLDHNGEVMFANAQATALFHGLRSGIHISSAIRTPAFLDALATAEPGRAPVTVSHVERVPVGRRLAVTVAALDPSGGGEKRPPLLVLLRDLTEQERVTQMRADFIANASHELRTPLSSLRGFVDTLRGNARDDPKARDRFLDIMVKQGERMSRLIDDLLVLSRIEMTAHLPPGDIVDVDETVAHVVDTLEPLAAERQIGIDLTRLEEPAHVRGDRDELVQVFQNLIHNAIKYSPAGVRVAVRLERKQESDRARFLRIVVQDHGQGIEAVHIPRLTERFYRVDAASSREKGGTGLGLAIVKHILNRHGAELAVNSNPGKGSTFTVVLRELIKP